MKFFHLKQFAIYGINKVSLNYAIVSKHTEITMIQCNKDGDAFSNRTSTVVKMAVKINDDAAVVYTS